MVLSATYLVCILIYHLTFLDYNRGKIPNFVLYFESLTRPKHHNTDIAGICWEKLLSVTDNTNALVQHWSNLFSLLTSKHVPLSKMHASETFCPWVNSELEGLLWARDKL